MLKNLKTCELHTGMKLVDYLMGSYGFVNFQTEIYIYMYWQISSYKFCRLHILMVQVLQHLLIYFKFF